MRIGSSNRNVKEFKYSVPRDQSEESIKEFPSKSYLNNFGSSRENRNSSWRGLMNNNSPMKTSKRITNKTKAMDYTNNSYNEAVTRLKLMLAESESNVPSRIRLSGLRNGNDNESSDNMSVIERPVLFEISKPTPTHKSNRSSILKLKSFSSSKDDLICSPFNRLSTMKAIESGMQPQTIASVQAPMEIFDFIEKQEDYIDQLEKESIFCRTELSNLLEKVKKVIDQNEALTEHAQMELLYSSKNANPNTSLSSDSDDVMNQSEIAKKSRKLPSTLQFSSGSSIIMESRISELEAKLMQSNIDLQNFKIENDDLKRKLALDLVKGQGQGQCECEAHRKQIEFLQVNKVNLEGTIRQLEYTIEELKSNASRKRYNPELAMERSQSELEIKHLRDELDRQPEQVRQLQQEMSRRIAEERSNVERRYNSQVNQLGSDLNNQSEQIVKLQLELERQRRLESDLKREISQRNAQIEELKKEVEKNRSTFVMEMVQANAEKQSLEQEIISVRLELDRCERGNKVESSRLNAEINSLRQRLDRSDADLLNSKREVLRLNEEIANLEKEMAYGEMKNETYPNKRIVEMQAKHDTTVSELEEMIQSQKRLMDRLTNECKTLTKKLEDTTFKHRMEITSLQSNVEILTDRMISNNRSDQSKISSTPYDSFLESKELRSESEPASDNAAPPTNTNRTSSIPTESNSYTNESILNKDVLGTNSLSALNLPSIGEKTDIESISGLADDSAYKYRKDTDDSAYKYRKDTDVDDENRKDINGEGEKQQQQQQQYRGETKTDINDYNNESSVQEKSFEKDDYTIDDDGNTSRSFLANSSDRNEYRANYGEFEGLDSQQYNAYEDTYDQQSDGNQQLDDVTDPNPLQYEGYEKAQQLEKQSDPEPPVSNELPKPTVSAKSPSVTNLSSGSSSIAKRRQTGEGRLQSRQSNSTLGTGNTRSKPAGGSNILPKQSSTSAKSGRKE